MCDEEHALYAVMDGHGGADAAAFAAAKMRDRLVANVRSNRNGPRGRRC